jgi:hypothetical protein
VSVSWLTRHVLSLGVLVFALAIVGTVFTFARPEYRPTSYTTTVDMAHQDHYTVAQVEQAFDAHAIPLAVMITTGMRSTVRSSLRVRGGGGSLRRFSSRSSAPRRR